MKKTLGAACAAFFSILGTAASAAEKMGQPGEWQLGLQPAASPVMHSILAFHNGLLLPIISAIALFVLALLIYVMLRFNARANPVPSKNTHNTLVEVIWTVVPVVILIVIAIPSFRLLFLEARLPSADLTIKAIGSMWRWDYEYPDHNNISFTANMVEESALKPGEPRLLTADHQVVVPVGKVVRVTVTATDVIHAWAVPAFGVKIDAVPGRLNETWFKADREGTFYGQCSELCGQNHAFMPIQIRVVSEDLFKRWAAAAEQDMDAAAQILAEADAAQALKLAATGAQ